LGGATIARASLHGAAEISRRDLRLGDQVWIEKAGEIIPQLTGVELDQRPPHLAVYEVPTHCPVCSSRLESDEDPTHLSCPNFECREQVIQRLLHFASSGAMGIRGLGPGLARKLVEGGLVESPADLYYLREEQLIALPGVGSKTALKLLSAIEGSLTRSLDRVLVGLGLPGVGPSGADSIAAQLTNLEQLLSEESRDLALGSLGLATQVEVSRFLAQTDVRKGVLQLAEALR